jgi:transcriptional regulator with XRE-family HTH domain
MNFGRDINYVSFGLVMKRVREERGLALREAAEESGLDAATHCRAERGARLDFDTYGYLCRWAGFPFEAFERHECRGAHYAAASADDKIEVTVHADPHLKPETAAALAALMRAAYRALTVGRRKESSESHERVLA